MEKNKDELIIEGESSVESKKERSLLDNMMKNYYKSEH